MSDWVNHLLTRLRRGERRRAPRVNEEHRQVLRRQYQVASRIAQRLGTTPEELLDYTRADRILANHR